MRSRMCSGRKKNEIVQGPGINRAGFSRCSESAIPVQTSALPIAPGTELISLKRYASASAFSAVPEFFPKLAGSSKV